jgi:hypothetical protein
MSDREGERALTGNEGRDYAKENLVQVKVNDQQWTVLWRDPLTGQFWKEYFPHSERHGGGPSSFVKITEEQALAEFGPIV